MDSLSFRLSNLLLGNAPGTPALEIQLLGPTLEVLSSLDMAIVGGEPHPMVDAEPAPVGRSFRIRKGTKLNFGALRKGARSYLAVSGGFDRPKVLGSAATFVRGGIGGAALATGDILSLAAPYACDKHRALPLGVIPELESPAVIQVTAGPHFDWLDEEGRKSLIEGPWKVTAQSDRTGIRLAGPEITFSRRAKEKAPEHGSDPTNIINTGYPIGGVNLCGRTPIVLPFDGPSQGGFITPLVVTSGAMWKLGQLRPHEKLTFQRVSQDEAVAHRRALEDMLSSPKLLTASLLVAGAPT
jgi:urea carboxylase